WTSEIRHTRYEPPPTPGAGRPKMPKSAPCRAGNAVFSIAAAPISRIPSYLSPAAGPSVNRETGPAAAGRLGVRVAHREVAAHQFVGVVQLRPAQQVQADGIDDDPGGATLDDQVVGLGLLVEFGAIM